MVLKAQKKLDVERDRLEKIKLKQTTNLLIKISRFALKMEHTGFEPVASTMPLWRAPSCANAPNNYIIRENI